MEVASNMKSKKLLSISFLPSICCFIFNRFSNRALCNRYQRKFMAQITSTEKILSPIIPLSDQREYGQFSLRNGIDVTVVHDPISEKASACICVAAGAANDPNDYPGLAHFTEHVSQRNVRLLFPLTYVSADAFPGYFKIPTRKSL